MKSRIISLLFVLSISLVANAQVAKVYNEEIDPMAQIDSAVAKAAREGKFVVCQVGGNWCPWCLRFADFIQKDEAIRSVVEQNYEYIHVNYPRRGAAQPLMKRLGYAARFGFPALVILDGEGQIVHIQDSGLLENGQSYDSKKVLQFFKGWTPKAVGGEE